MIPRCLWAQDNCATEFANRDQYKQWVDYDRANGRNTTLGYNTTQLSNAQEALDKCLKTRLTLLTDGTNTGDLSPGFSYVSLNPVRAGLVGDAADWAWSSVRAHLARNDDGLVRRG
jgi:hypothetical protein